MTRPATELPSVRGSALARTDARANDATPGLEPLRTIVPRVLARLCLTCDADAAPDDTHCAPCRAEVENDPHPELVQ